MQFQLASDQEAYAHYAGEMPYLIKLNDVLARRLKGAEQGIFRPVFGEADDGQVAYKLYDDLVDGSEAEIREKITEVALYIRW
jgi:hypothetical protein